MDSLFGSPVPAGFLIGVIAGFFVRRARLCSFGAIESALIGGDWRRMKVFGMALGVALVLTQTMALTGLIDPGHSTYVNARIPLLATAFGSLTFGLGMALVGTCAFGSLVRLGSGDLRALVTLMVFGALSYATLRGVLSPMRLSLFEAVTISLPGAIAGTLEAFAAAMGGALARVGLIGLLALGLVGAALLDPRLWRAPKLMTA
ncbi:MAG TPA: YeeE/YedE thiosulfate transporter family protein, partial [Beijerinckiaceae bacterium]|nr:YeeE/YedE thiosulfate transporter family protein [Beijerinckiaceae bacterium]